MLAYVRNLLLLYLYASMCCVQTSSPSEFIQDIQGYRNACKVIGWEPKQDCTAYNVIAFHAYLKSTLYNVTPNTTITFESVHLNKGDGYDPATGIFTAPEDGVYSFAWSFLSKKGGTVYFAAVVKNADRVHTCINNQQSTHISTSGYLIYELKRGNKVWIRTWYVPATYIHGGYYTYFSGSKINSI